MPFVGAALLKCEWRVLRVCWPGSASIVGAVLLTLGRASGRSHRVPSQGLCWCIEGKGYTSFCAQAGLFKEECDGVLHSSICCFSGCFVLCFARKQNEDCKQACWEGWKSLAKWFLLFVKLVLPVTVGTAAISAYFGQQPFPCSARHE